MNAVTTNMPVARLIATCHPSLFARTHDVQPHEHESRSSRHS
jgi:hypothetical protein